MARDLAEFVSVHGDGYAVNIDGGPFYVMPTEVFGWTICYGEDLQFIITDSGPAIGFPSAEAAVEAILQAAAA